MKLIKLHVHEFGKLHDFDYTFNDGLNCIYEDNGWGKSSIAAFICAMFYGMNDDSRKNASIMTERRKYMPWDASIMSGYIVFEYKNKEYRLERSFGQKIKDDTTTIYDNITNSLVQDFSTPNIGEEIFEVDKNTYERSTYITQNKIIVEKTADISARLSNAVQGDDDISLYDRAVDLLEKKRGLYAKKRGKGKIDEYKDEILKCKEKLKAIASSSSTLNDKKKEFSEYTQTQVKYEDRIKRLDIMLATNSTYAANQEKKRAYETLKSNLETKQTAYNSAISNFGGVYPQEELVKDITSSINEYVILTGKEAAFSDISSQKIKYEEYKKTFNNRPVEADNKRITNKYNDYKSSINDYNKQKAVISERLSTYNQIEDVKSTMPIIPVAFILLAIATIILGVLNIMDINSAILYIAGALSGVVGVVLLASKKKKRKLQNEEADNRQADIDNLKNSNSELLRECTSESRDILDYCNTYNIRVKHDNGLLVDDISEALYQIRTDYQDYLQLDKLINDFTMYTTKKEELSKHIYETGRKCNIILENVLNANTAISISNAYEQCKLYYKDIEKLKNDIALWEKDNDYARIMNTPKPEIMSDDIQKEKNELSDKLAIIRQNIKNCEISIEQLEDILASQLEINERILVLEEQEDYASNMVSLIDNTLINLEKAKEQYEKRYIQKMKESYDYFYKLFAQDGMDNYEKADIDTMLNISVKDSGLTRNIEYYSSGTKDFVNLSYRFAIIEAIFEGELPYIILDDPLVNMDERRIKAAKRVLQQISTKYQMIYLTCSKERTF